MLVQKELKNPALAMALKNIDEKELFLALEPFLMNQPQLLKLGKHKPFKPFKAIKMEGEGITASEMVVRDRT